MTTNSTAALSRPDEDLVPEWDVADRLAKSLRERNIGVGEMADAFGLSRQTIGRWLSGRGVPSKAQLFFWATLTGVNLTWLETGEAPTNGPAPRAAVSLLPRLDSNQQPSGYRPARLFVVKPRLTTKWTVSDRWASGLENAA